MTKQSTTRWILAALLGLLVVGAACMPIVQAGGKATPGAGAEPADRGEIVDVGDSKAPVTVDEFELLVMESFPMQVLAIVRGHLSNGCVVLDSLLAERTGDGFVIKVETHQEGDLCTMALVPFEQRVALNVYGLQAGTYSVRAGEVSAEFTLPVDNQPVDAPPADNAPAEGVSMDHIQDLRGTVTAIETGVDGIQVELAVGEAVYSVTISVLQAEVYGRWEDIQPGAELVVSGPMIAGIEPVLVVAERVAVVGSDSDYVRNLRATVTGVESGPVGLQAEIRAEDGTDYRVTFDPATTEIVYLGEGTEIQVGSPVLVSGELFYLIAAQFAPRIAADVAVVQPTPPTDTIEARPIPLAG